MRVCGACGPRCGPSVRPRLQPGVGASAFVAEENGAARPAWLEDDEDVEFLASLVAGALGRARDPGPASRAGLAHVRRGRRLSPRRSRGQSTERRSRRGHLRGVCSPRLMAGQQDTGTPPALAERLRTPNSNRSTPGHAAPGSVATNGSRWLRYSSPGSQDEERSTACGDRLADARPGRRALHRRAGASTALEGGVGS
jgi:hypothetical protein